MTNSKVDIVHITNNNESVYSLCKEKMINGTRSVTIDYQGSADDIDGQWCPACFIKLMRDF